MAISRRLFLNWLAAAGGSSLVYNASLAMGLIVKDDGFKAPNIAPVSSNASGNSVVVLGAGIGGLATAYELKKAGYKVLILEASHRAGGRNLTVRHGDIVDELGNKQVCNFDDDPELYMNCGPARLPGHHRRILHYCKELKVPLRVFANSNRMAYVHDSKNFGGRPQRVGELLADGRGFVAELAQKGLKQGVLDQTMTAEDIDKFKNFLSLYGDLSKEGQYKGSERAGSTLDRMLFHAHPNPPHELKELLNSPLFYRLQFITEAYDWAEPLLTPVGGMDKVVEGFKSHLNSDIELGAQVKSVQQKDNGVEVRYVQNGEVKTHFADYCFNNIPAHFMGGIYNNLSSDYQAALNALKRGKLFKIGLQMKSRFWENEGIYGGISYTDLPVAQIWYPSDGINSQKGIMLGAYVWGDENNEYFERLSPQQRLEVAASNGEQIHEGYSSYIETGVSIPWSRMNHMMGCGSRMSEEDHDKYFALLQKPEGRHFMIGDQISFHPGWQEGALASVEVALSEFNKMVSTGA